MGGWLAGFLGAAVLDRVSANLARTAVRDGLRHYLDSYNEHGGVELSMEFEYGHEALPSATGMTLFVHWDPKARLWPYSRGIFDEKTGEFYVIVHSIKRTLTEEDLPAIEHSIGTSIRHEIQHGFQKQQGRLPPIEEIVRALRWTSAGRVDFSDPDNVITYYTMPYEVEARMASVRFDARSRGIPLREALDEKFDDLQNSLRFHGVSKPEIERVIRTVKPLYEMRARLPISLAGFWRS